MLVKDSLIRVYSDFNKVYIGIYSGFLHGIILTDPCMVIAEGKSPEGQVTFSVRKVPLPWIIVHPGVIEPVTENDQMYIPYKRAMAQIIVTGSRIISGGVG
jgi:hypothetical protein